MTSKSVMPPGAQPSAGALRFARLNHILIPSTKDARDRFRAGILGRVLRPAGALYSAFSDEGRILVAAAGGIGAFGLDVQSTVVYLLWCALAGILFASLAATPFFTPRGMSLEVDAPRRVTIGEPIAFSLVLRNRGEGARDRDAVRVHGPFLPWDGSWVGAPPPSIPLDAGNERRVELIATFSERGEHHLDGFYATCLVPLGLAQGAAVSSMGVRFLVVPSVARVARLALAPRRGVGDGGAPRPSRTGDTMNLLGVRPYRRGDSVRRLHARTSARRGEPMIREDQEDQSQRVGVVLDVGARDARTFEACLSLVAGVVRHLNEQRGGVDLLVVGDRPHELRGGAPGGLARTLDVLARAERGKACDPDRTAARLSDRAARISAVVVVTAYPEPGLFDAIRRSTESAVLLIVGVDAAESPQDTGSSFNVPVAAIERGERLAFG